MAISKFAFYCFSARCLKSSGEGQTACLCWALWPGCNRNCRNPPNGVANIICHKQCARSIQGHTDRSSLCIAVFNQEACQHFHGVAEWHAIRKWYEDHSIPVRYLTVPRSMLSDKHSIRKWSGQACPNGRRQAQRRGM